MKEDDDEFSSSEGSDDDDHRDEQDNLECRKVTSHEEYGSSTLDRRSVAESAVLMDDEY